MEDDSSGRFDRLSTDEILEKLIEIIERSGTPWISWERVDQEFSREVGRSLEDCLRTSFYCTDIKRFLRESRMFSIYQKPDPTDFYIALGQQVAPYPLPTPKQRIPSYRVKRRWKVDYHIAKMLRTEFGQSQVHSPTPKDRWSQQPTHKDHLRDQSFIPSLPPQIGSRGDLERALVLIVKYLSSDNTENGVPIDQLARYFLANYKTPIRSILRQHYPNTRLIELLGRMPQFQVEGSGSEVQIFFTNVVDNLDPETPS